MVAETLPPITQFARLKVSLPAPPVYDRLASIVFENVVRLLTPSPRLHVSEPRIVKKSTTTVSSLAAPVRVTPPFTRALVVKSNWLAPAPRLAATEPRIRAPFRMLNESEPVVAVLLTVIEPPRVPASSTKLLESPAP